MKKSVCLLVALTISFALYAQENSSLSKEELLSIFKQYNPTVLEKASFNKAYGDILTELVNSYSLTPVEQSKYELIALALNFDNSLRLQVLRDQYFEGRNLQTMSGISVSETLDGSIRSELKKVINDIFDNTIKVKKMQLKDCKTQRKQTHKDTTLSPEQKQQRVALLSSNIKQIKQDIRSLKYNSKQKIQDTADAYFAEMAANYISSQWQQLSAEQSSSRDVKADHKKPTAE